MKLYSPSNNFKLSKILFASSLLSHKIQHIQVPFDHKNKQFIAQYPNFSLPSLFIPQKNQYIFGTDSILLHLFQQNTSKLSQFQQCQIYQWLEFSQKELQNSIAVHVLYQDKIQQITQENLNKAKENIIKGMKIIDQRLKLRTYVVGDSVSVVDVAIFQMFRALKQNFEKQMKNFTCLKRWIINLEAIRKQVCQ